jgi:hypothetical protein
VKEWRVGTLPRLARRYKFQWALQRLKAKQQNRAMPGARKSPAEARTARKAHTMERKSPVKSPVKSPAKSRTAGDSAAKAREAPAQESTNNWPEFDAAVLAHAPHATAQDVHALLAVGTEDTTTFGEYASWWRDCLGGTAAAARADARATWEMMRGPVRKR